MHDRELKNILEETCAIRPGQEARAWAALREQLYGANKAKAGWSWIYTPAWRGALLGVSLVCALLVMGNVLVTKSQPALASADSASPGIYATSFYSSSAQAQVVWLNGLEPATDKPTYLDPTTKANGSGNTPPPGNDHSL